MSEETEEFKMPDLSQMGRTCKMASFVMIQIQADYYEIYMQNELNRFKEAVDTLKEEKPKGYRKQIKELNKITKAERVRHTTALNGIRSDAMAFKSLLKTIPGEAKRFQGMCNLVREATQYALTANNPEEWVYMIKMYPTGAFDEAIDAFHKSGDAFDRDLTALTDSLDRRIEQDKAVKAHEASMTVDDLLPKPMSVLRGGKEETS